MKKNSRVQLFRLVIQLLFLTIVSLIAFMHQTAGGGPGGIPNIHATCPFGGLESLYKFLADGAYLSKINPSSLILFAGTVLLTLVAARFFCAWICALGTLQELFGKLGKKLFKRRFFIPSVVDKPLRYLKYGVLVAVLFLTWKTGVLIINNYDPFSAYAHIPGGWEEISGSYLIGFLILVFSLLLSLLYDRFFCKYLCPMGGFLALVSGVSPFKIKRNREVCSGCHLCDKVCPVNIHVSSKEVVSSAECIGCYECVSACGTKPNSLKLFWRKRRVKMVTLILTALILYPGVIVITNITGNWRMLPADISSAVGADPQNIRGWMTLEHVSEEFQIDLKRLYKKLGVTEELLPRDTKIKEMDALLYKKGVEFDHDRVKVVVTEILTHGGSVPPAGGKGFELKGSMTVLSASEALKVAPERFIRTLGLPKDITRDIPLRDLQEEFGFKMSDLKEIPLSP